MGGAALAVLATMRRLMFSMAISLLGCATDDKGPEENVPADGKEDSFAKPTDHGAISFATQQQATLAGSASYHTWTFSLSGAASIHAFTSRIAHDKTLDTVLYLYKKTSAGTWGAYIARDDDGGSSVLSSLTRSLGAGDYRVLVKGHDSSVKGPFGVEVDCTGAGCTAQPAGCVFGDSQDDLNNNANPNLLQNKSSFTYQQYLDAHFDATQDARVIAALHESTHTEVTTVAQAFAAADQNEIDIVHIYDLLGAREFIAIEYGAGDNPYGAIFDSTTATRVAGLQDSDITSCTVTTATCALHQNISDFKADAAWTKISTKTITVASQLSGTQATDALAAIEVAYTEATSLANGLTLIDQGGLGLTTYQKGSTTVELYDYGAGDNEYGAFYVAGTTTLAAEVHDGDFYRCAIDE